MADDDLRRALARTRNKPLREALARTRRSDVEMIWRGDWSSAVRYTPGDCVAHDCTTWCCIKAHKASEPPSAVWHVLVCKPEKGEKGDKGNTGIGIEGPAGPQGPPGAGGT